MAATKNQRGNAAVCITGVSTGIGYDATHYLIDRGYTVFGSVRTIADRERLEAEFPDRFHALSFDVTNGSSIVAEADRVATLLAGQSLAALVNNAGVAVAGPLELLDDDVFEQQLKINLLGTRLVTNAFLPLLRSRGGGPPGKIINISSLSGIINTPLNGAYCVSKHAMESLGEVYRRELHQDGIQVSSIQAGPIASKIWDKNADSMGEFIDTHYRSMIETTNRVIRDASKNALPAEEVSRRIHLIIESPRPKLSYIIGASWSALLLAKVLPTRVADRLIARYLR